MSVDVQNRFIILKKIRYAEADLILQALSPLGEKMSFMARAALKSKKRFGGGILEPGNFVQLTYRPSAEGRMHTLKEAALLNAFAGIRQDYDRLEFGLKALEAVGRVSQEGDSTSEFLFNLLGHTLKALETTESVEILRVQFQLKFLLQQGVLTAEPWMGPFLKTNISEHGQLGEHLESARRQGPGLDLLVEQYIQTAGLS